MKNKIMGFIRTRGNGVSFVELEDHISGFKGDFEYGDFDQNLLYWSGISEEAISAIQDLVRDGRLTMKRTDFLVYLIDGKILKMPIAKSIRAYKRLRWLPILFYTNEKPTRHEIRQALRETAKQEGGA